MEQLYYTLTEATERLKMDAIQLGECGVLAIAYRLQETTNTENTGFFIEYIKPGWQAVDFLYVTAAQFRKIVNADRTKDRAILRDTFVSLDEWADSDEVIKRRDVGVHVIARKMYASGVKPMHLFAGLNDMYVTAEAMKAYEAIAPEPTAKQAPPQASPEPAPVVQAPERKRKHRTLWDVVTPYIVEVMQAGQYATAKELFNALEAKAGAGSPFDKGQGNNRYSLFAREISKPMAMKTLQTRWPVLKAAAKK